MLHGTLYVEKLDLTLIQKKQKKERKKGVKKKNYNTKTQIQLLKCFISCCPAQYTGYAVLCPNFALYTYISEYFI